MSHRFSSRLEELRKSIDKKKIHGFLITDIVNVRYLSGFRGSSAFILITKNKNIFVTDFRYKEEAETELRIGKADPGWDIAIEKGDRFKTVKSLCAGLDIRVLGFESSASYDFFEGLSRCAAELKPLRGVVEKMRTIKDLEEIKFIKESIRRAENAFLDVRPFIRRGRREREIALFLETRLKKRGCKRLPFDIIVASGPNSAMPHAQATDRKLSPGDFVVVDWGGEAEGYCSDMTRTFILKGSPSPKSRGDFRDGSNNISKKIEIYQAVLEANRKAVAVVAPGLVSRMIDNSARDSIKKAGYEEFFGHGTGHGVGLEVHELPRISWTRNDAVREGMIFTIEPGIYMDGLGGVRIEDMVLVKARGCEVLTKLPRKLEII